ncbi:MAG TPA: hypothetical protein VKE93_15925 [Candidatus Angelobacter sp.]|nr:hypothetical protein [Candidatus Angelobacter sp.]
MKNQSCTRILIVALVASFWLTQQAWPQAAAQKPAQSQAGSAPASAVPSAQKKDEPASQAQATPAGGTADGGSAQPVTSYPDASGADQQNQPAQAGSLPAAPQPKTQPAEPQGAATAEKVPTSGGAAAKPAGVAIAPARQHRTRSLLIKVGALAAAGVAAGTVYALSRGTPSVPPGSNSSVAVPK